MELSKPDIHDLSQAVNETTNSAILDGVEMLYIYTLESSQPVRMHSKIGTRNPLYCTGLGKAILAFLPNEERSSLLDQITLTPRTANTIVDKTTLIEHLNLIHTQGFAIDDAEGEEGGRCVAAPIFDYTGHVFAALSVSGPAYRTSTSHLVEIAPLVMKAAGAISRKLGYVPAIEASTP